MTEQNKYSILVVEDDENSLEFIQYNLEKADFHVLTANNGKEGLQLLQENDVDLIICDIMMPEMDGYTFHDRILLDPSTRDLPFIFLSAKSRVDDLVEGFRSGVDEYITKPFEPLVFVARVQRILERRKILAEMSRVDSLTKLLNKFTFEKEVRKEMERLTRYSGIASLIYIVIDDLKQVANLHGHSISDLIIVRFAEILQKLTRKIDITARYGGSSFAIYCPETQASTAKTMIRRLLERFQGYGFGPENFHMSFSAGISETPLHGDDFSTILSRAVQAIDQARMDENASISIWRTGQES